jgi:hypothetical protein
MTQYSTVHNMLMKLARQSVKCCFQTEIENNMLISLSSLRREYRMCYASWAGLLITANKYDEMIDKIPAGAKFITNVGYALK